MNRDLMFSNKNNAWCTPKDFFKELNTEFHFTLDPCCLPKSALCEKYYTPDDDGLKQSWDNEVVFCNPPYGREIGKWVKKASEAVGGVVVMLIPSRTDTRYFHDYIYHKSEIRFLKGRLKFIDMDFKGKEEDRKMSPAPFPSMLIIFRNKREVI